MVMLSNPNSEVILLLKVKKRKVSCKLSEEAERVGSRVSEHTFCMRVTNSSRESTSSSLTLDKYFWMEDLLMEGEGIAGEEFGNGWWVDCEGGG